MIAIEVIASWIIVSPVRFPVKTESFFLERHNFFLPSFNNRGSISITSSF